MIDEILKRVTEKTGLSPDQAKGAVETVLGFLKEKLPAPLASSLDSFIGAGASSATASGSGLVDQASSAIGNVFGPKS